MEDSCNALNNWVGVELLNPCFKQLGCPCFNIIIYWITLFFFVWWLMQSDIHIQIVVECGMPFEDRRNGFQNRIIV